VTTLAWPSGTSEKDEAERGASAPLEIAQQLLGGISALSEEVAKLRAERDDLQIEARTLRQRLTAAEADLRQWNAITAQLQAITARTRAMIEPNDNTSDLVRLELVVEQSVEGKRVRIRRRVQSTTGASGAEGAREAKPGSASVLEAATWVDPGPIELTESGTVPAALYQSRPVATSAIAEASSPVAAAKPKSTKSSPASNTSSASRWESRILLGITSVVLAAILALTIGPKILPYQTFVVLSGSMEPAIAIGSVAVLIPASADQLAAGDVITFQRPDRPTELVTHRIVGIETGPAGRTFMTKGDANNVPDAWRVPASGTGWRYAFSIPKVGFLLRGFQTGEGRLALLVVPELGIVLLSLLYRRSSRRKQQQQTLASA
jgi:signal peptidase